MPQKVMVYEVKASPVVQENYGRLFSADRERFYWNVSKFQSLALGDFVFVVNPTSSNVLFTKLEETNIDADYASESDLTSFTDEGHSYSARKKFPAFVRLRVIEESSNLPSHQWRTPALGSAENTFLLKDSIQPELAKKNLTGTSSLLDAFPAESEATPILLACREFLTSAAQGDARSPVHTVEAANDASGLLDILKKYADEGIVFHSTERRAAYSISEYEAGKFQVERLDGNEPAPVSEQTYLNKRQQLHEHDGRLPFSGFDGTSAVRNAVLQARPLALSADKREILDVTNLELRSQLFCEILQNLKVGGSPDSPILYKPAMLACVIEAIGEGALKENKITFDFIAPRFREKMRFLGKKVNDENAAQPFYHLTGDMIWLHAVNSLQDPMRNGNEGPAAARNKIKYALLKDTFWELLQDPEARRMALKTLESKWFSPVASTGFWWVCQGTSYRAELAGGYIQAPQKGRDGTTTKFYWDNVGKVAKGDLIFHYADGSIRAVSTATSEPAEVELEAEVDSWAGTRWRVESDYVELPDPVPIGQVGTQLANLGDSYSPVDRNGQANQGYLFELSSKAVAIVASKLDLDSLPEDIGALLNMPKPTPIEPWTVANLVAASTAIRDSGLIYPKDLLKRFVCSLLAKPFVLLTGTSGTGKTKLAQYFARWLVGEDGYELVPVGADWTDNRNILGHFNPFAGDRGEFVSTRVLDLILRAQKNRDSPHFLILDEMNLSHVERYFADFLSAMESGDPISLHRNGSKVQTADGREVAEEITIPKNLFVVGTVNIDETTNMFSPKVLDRANVIEFFLGKGDLETFLTSADQELRPVASAPTATAKGFLGLSKARSEATLSADDSDRLKGTLLDLFGLLDGSGMDFGFRTPAEMKRYFQFARILTDDAGWDWNKTCDAQILQKILPKLHGSRRRIERLLMALASYCADRDAKAAAKHLKDSGAGQLDLDSETPEFENSFAKLSQMIRAVRRDQFVSFIQ